MSKCELSLQVLQIASISQITHYYENNLEEVMGCKSFHVVRFHLGPLLLIIGPRGLQCENDLYEIMDCESFDVVRLHLGPLLQGQIRVAKLKRAFTLLINEKCFLSSKLC